MPTWLRLASSSEPTTQLGAVDRNNRFWAAQGCFRSQNRASGANLGRNPMGPKTCAKLPGLSAMAIWGRFWSVHTCLAVLKNILNFVLGRPRSPGGSRGRVRTVIVGNKRFWAKSGPDPGVLYFCFFILALSTAGLGFGPAPAPNRKHDCPGEMATKTFVMRQALASP